jgi:cobalt-precorrin-5B (C1)-methyltransferase
MARSGYTLPVFAVASAKAALVYLLRGELRSPIALNLLPEITEIPIQQIALLDQNTALAITLSDPGDNLDLTRNTPIWAWVSLSERQDKSLILEAGEGLGRTTTGEPAIYNFARQLFDVNLASLIPEDRTAIVRIILPEGRQLAQRTSNQAFGILEGLALLGTSGIAKPLSAEAHLEELRANLQEKVKQSSDLVFCIGSHGQQVAQRLGISEAAIVPTGNWIGALLAEAGLRGANSVLLLGYHGKLIKLAGGIFNTSSHLADAKLEIIAAAVAQTVGNLEAIQAVLQCSTADQAYKTLLDLGFTKVVFQLLSNKIVEKATQYVKKYADATLEIKVILCDRNGNIIS